MALRPHPPRVGGERDWFRAQGVHAASPRRWATAPPQHRPGRGVRESATSPRSM